VGGGGEGGGEGGGGVPPINLPLWRGNLSDLSPEVRQLPLQRSERQILADIPAGVGGISGFGGGGGSVPSGLVHDMQAVRDVACISLRGRAVRYAPIFYNFAHPMPSVASMPGLFYLNTRLLTLVRTSGMPRFTITRLLTSSIPPFRLPLEEEEEEEWRRSAAQAATTGTEECRSSSNDRNTSPRRIRGFLASFPFLVRSERTRLEQVVPLRTVFARTQNVLCVECGVTHARVIYPPMTCILLLI